MVNYLILGLNYAPRFSFLSWVQFPTFVHFCCEEATASTTLKASAPLLNDEKTIPKFHVPPYR